MAYLTTYTAEVYKDGYVYSLDYERLKEEIIKKVGFDPFEYPCKWYAHEVDLKAISRKYPDTVIYLKGEGEDTGDLWIKYFIHGKVQLTKAKLEFDEFDPEKAQ